MVTKRRTQAERTAASDKAMFKAAITILAKEGPNALTLAKVGKQAGFTAGLVSYRFGSKLNLLKAVSERILETWKQQVIEAEGNKQGGLAALEHITKLYFGSIQTKSDLTLALYKLMHASYSDAPELREHFQQYDEELRREVCQFVELGKQRQEFNSSVDSEQFASLYIGALRGLAIQYFINDDDNALKQMEQTVVDYCRDFVKQATKP